MSIGNVNNDNTTWGVSSYASNAAAFGAIGSDGGFEEALKSSVGFGAKNESGGVVASIEMAEKTENMLGRLQLAFLQSNSAGGVDSRLDNALF